MVGPRCVHGSVSRAPSGNLLAVYVVRVLENKWELAHSNAVIDLDVAISYRTFLLDDSESRFIYTGEPLTPIQSTGKLH